jgi:hypothetical protein
VDGNGQSLPNADRYGYAGSSTSVGAVAAVPAGQDPAGRPLQGLALPWPRTLINGSITNVIYQPQIESWDGSALVARNAVAVQTEGVPQAIYGVIHVRATTFVDRTNRTVSLLNMEVTDAEFPSAPDRKDEFLKAIREQYPGEVQVISLASLESAVAANQQQQKAAAQPLNNTPPRIIVSTRPAMLVSIDGNPSYRPVDGTDLERVVNTRLLILRDRAGRHYLHMLNGYVASATLEGPWTLATAPKGAAAAEKEARQNGVDLLEAPAEEDRTLTEATVPDVYVSSTPAELVTFDGEPDFVPITGTQLLYVTNTTANVFKLLSDQKNYALLAGRWFRAPSFNGPWEYVAGNQLPGDFAKIPDNSPKENVKASVPGTPQAKEALIANSIPTSTSVARNATINPPQIDGSPRLEAISGTPLHYVANSGTPIIKVDEHSWYACQDGVWYVASSLAGPWVVAESVPAVVYSIPASSPMHYVTYVRVYDSNSQYIYQGYTPGYLGTVVSSDTVVVYGTGYYYSPWVGSYWYGGPVTWGMGWGPFWSPWTSWSYGFGFGWYYWDYYPHYHHHHYYACHPPNPHWGPYHKYAPPALSPYRPAAVHTSGNVYQPPVRTRPSTREFRDATAPARFAGAYNSRTGKMAAGQNAQVENVFRPTMGSVATAPVRGAAAATPYTGGARSIRGTAPTVFANDGNAASPANTPVRTTVTPNSDKVVRSSASGRERTRVGVGNTSSPSFQPDARGSVSRSPASSPQMSSPARTIDRSSSSSMPPGIRERRRN